MNPVATLPPPADGMVMAADRVLETMRVVLGARTAPAGSSPKEVIWKKNKSRLFRYVRQTPATHRTPIFLSMPLINRTYVIDLSPGNSFVEFLLGQGFDVFLYDWGVWGPEDRNVGLSDLVARYMPRAIRAASQEAESDVTLLGYCIGGTLAASFAALYPEAPVKNLVLFTAPIDFADAGFFGKWVAKGSFPLEKVREVLPSMPGELIDVGSKLLNPLPNTIGNFVRLYERLGDPNFDVEGWQAMYRWVNEGTPFPARAYYEWISEFYRENTLVKGRFRVDDRPVRLSNIRVPLLNVAASADTIAPRPTTQVIMDLVSSADKEELLLQGGHVGIVVGRGARNNLWPKVVDWLVRHD
jgi:polyhydroxyalkanoate synthase